MKIWTSSKILGLEMSVKMLWLVLPIIQQAERKSVFLFYCKQLTLTLETKGHFQDNKFLAKQRKSYLPFSYSPYACQLVTSYFTEKTEKKYVQAVFDLQ